MLVVYIALMICTMTPVLALQAGADMSVLVWLVFGLVIVKAVLLVDHFMEMKHAPWGWRMAAVCRAAGLLLVSYNASGR